MQFNASELNVAIGGRRNNGNQNGNKNKNKNKNKNNGSGNKQQSAGRGSAILDSGMEFERGSGDRSFGDDVNSDDVVVDIDTSAEVEAANNKLRDFLEEYEEMCSERGNQVADVIRDLFWEVSKIMTHYYEPKYEAASAKMNKVLDVMATQRFETTLANILTNEDVEGWNDGTNNIWKSVMFSICTVLTTCHKSMKDETISGYIDLLASKGLAGNDINRLVKDLGITKDLAVDLVAAIPVIPDDMTDITLRQFYESFCMKLMEHAEENIDVLDRGTQGKLFTFFFGNNHVALKAIGRMLASTKITGFVNESQKLIYAEYLSMLADRLDAYEIKDIKFVLKFLVSEKKRKGKDSMILFGSVPIAEYDSIRKAEFELISSDPDAKEYLVMS